jgi:uracil-DNA glycosylase
MPNLTRIEESWRLRLAAEFVQPHFVALRDFVRDEYQAQTIYPPAAQLFRAFDECVPPPPSLKNIFKELDADMGANGGAPVRRDPDLTRWARQGVLLLNATLTVRGGAAGSHQNKGWEKFTDAAVSALAREREGLVFLLWGNYARKKGASIDRAKHLVLECAHPSPLSAHNGFFGCRHFSQANAYLAKRGVPLITW